MLIHVKVTPNAKKSQVVKEGNIYRVYANAPAVDGKANSALIEVLSGHFSVKKSSIRIIKGQKSREKLVEIVGNIRVRQSE